MREQLIERSLSELRSLFVEETKALISALESGAKWEDLRYLRDRIKDIMAIIDSRSNQPEKLVFS